VRGLKQGQGYTTWRLKTRARLYQLRGVKYGLG